MAQNKKKSLEKTILTISKSSCVADVRKFIANNVERHYFQLSGTDPKSNGDKNAKIYIDIKSKQIICQLGIGYNSESFLKSYEQFKEIAARFGEPIYVGSSLRVIL